MGNLESNATPQWQRGHSASLAVSPGPAHLDPDPLARSRPRIQPADHFPFTINDYISFERIVKLESKYHDPRIDTVSGTGLVLKINPGQSKVSGEKVSTGRVDAGKPLGVVTAVLNEAVLVAKQETMQLGDT